MRKGTSCYGKRTRSHKLLFQLRFFRFCNWQPSLETMENFYGIGVRNRYDLFYNDELDPLEILKQQEEEKEKKKLQPKEKVKNTKHGKDRTAAPTSSHLSKKAKDVLPASSSKPSEFTALKLSMQNRDLIGNAETSSKATRMKPSAEKPVRGYQANVGSKSDNVGRSPDDTYNVTDQREHSGEREFRRGRGSAFRFRGRGRGRGNFYSGESRKRDFDSQNANSKPVPEDTHQTSEIWDEPAEGFGQNSERKGASESWCDNTVYQPESTFPTESFSSATVNTESKENVPIVVSEETIDETIREMTLDEWKREQETKRAVPKFNLRKPGEGEDSNQWKKLYILKKKVKDTEENEEEEEPDDEEIERRGRQRQLVDIQINFNCSRRGRGRGRGTRGTGPRSGGPPPEDNRSRDLPSLSSFAGTTNRLSRGLSKSSKMPSAQSAPRVDDWNDFPSLITM